MQDRIYRIAENFLQRTAGPYIRVIHDRAGEGPLWSNFRSSLES